MTPPDADKTGNTPTDLADASLDDAQGGGLMDTPVGGWGVHRPPESFEPITLERGAKGAVFEPNDEP